ncbi:putative 1,4-beta-D-glucan cellobiohydrolase C [Cryoendolithus antarcticus]|uniref:Glucanase n=1 Tax=Cryoendolithus antarcticus TaxID=1507870 RepID=A0A1V8S930_9PEZI|nr:putative 1,4-beta-D-glucan cellobiohydrolase C [Cryoendolithus antarcticus]
MKQVFATAAAVFATQASAVAVWGQCGGKGWSGGTTCDSGSVCVAQNDYYSQCIPGTASTTATTLKTTTRATTTTVPASTTKVSTSVVSTSKASSTTVAPTTTKASTTAAGSTSAAGSTTTGTPVSASGNPFAGRQIYANPYYSSEIFTSAIPSLPASLQAKASAVANVGTYVWLDTAAKVPTMDTYLADIASKNAAGASPPILGAFVVYDLPNRDCAAYSSNGEYLVANGGLAKYYAYIDSIAAIIKKYPTTQINLVIEPDSLGNLVTNLNVAKCQEAQPAYESGVEYAMKTLNFANVAMYLDAGHAGWLGWSANIGPAAQLFARLYKAAGSPSSVRGLATNVANYNAFTIASAPSYTQGNSNYDEKLYIDNLAPLLVQYGYPAHFIVDVSRNGVQPTKQQAWGDWCNVIGTGFGVKPTTNTGDSLVDAFVWVKPGGEGDGTSDSSATRYDSHCGLSDALQPAPEAGTWFQAYFQQLLQNAAF